MKVKVGNLIVDSAKEPILLILSKEDRDNIAAMDEDATKFCSFPAGYEKKAIYEFMRTKPETESEIGR